MTLEELLALVPEDKKESLTEAWNSRESKISKVNGEAKGLRDRAKLAEEQLLKIKGKLGADELNDDILDRLVIKQTGTESDAELLAKVKQAYEKEKEQNLLLRQNLDKITAENSAKERNELITKAVAASGIHSEAINGAVKLVAMDAIFDTADNVWKFNGVTLDEYMKQFLVANPYLVKNSVASGTANTKVNSSKEPALLTKERYMAMTPAERKANQELIVKSARTWKA